MNTFRIHKAMLAASFALSFAPAQQAQDLTRGDVAKGATLAPGTVVIERGEDRIVVCMGVGQPTVTINGAQVPTRAGRRAAGMSCEADGYKVQLRSTAAGAADVYRRYLDLTMLPNADGTQSPFGSDRVRNEKTSQDGATTRPYIGVQVGSVPAVLCEHLELDPDKCVLILKATKGSPADEAGLCENDILIAIDDDGAATDASLRAAVAASNKGDTMVMRVLRRGRARTIEVRVGERTIEPKGYWGAVDPKQLNGYWNVGLQQQRAATLYGTLLPEYRAGVRWPEVLGKPAGDPLQEQLKKIERQVEKLQQQLEKLTR